MNEHTEQTKEMLFTLIAERFGTDSAFEEAAGLAPKTVSNWRRGRSASFMKMLPHLAPVLGVRAGSLLPAGEAESEDDARIMRLWRAAIALPNAERAALLDTIESVVRLYLGRRGDV